MMNAGTFEQRAQTDFIIGLMLLGPFSMAVGGRAHTVLFSEVTLDRNHASILSERDARGRSGPHVERI